LNHIFSEENKEFDNRIHLQRYKERTLKINLTRNESFSLNKKFIYPIDIANFKKMVFFVLMQQKTNRRLRVTLRDTYGNEIYSEENLSNQSKDKWNQLEFYFDQFTGYNRSNMMISEVRFDLLNELSDTSDNVIYIDEICMDEAMPSFGFAAKMNSSIPNRRLT